MDSIHSLSNTTNSHHQKDDEKLPALITKPQKLPTPLTKPQNYNSVFLYKYKGDFEHIYNDIKHFITNDDLEKYTRWINTGDISRLFDFKYFLAVYHLEYNRIYLKYFKIEFCEEFENLIELLLLNNIVAEKNIENITNSFFEKMLSYGLNMFGCIKEPNDNSKILCVNDNPSYIKFLNNPSEELILTCVKRHVVSVKNIKCYIDDDLLKKIIQENYEAIAYLPQNRLTLQIYEYAISVDRDAINYIYDKNMIRELIHAKNITIEDMTMYIYNKNLISRGR